MSNCPKCNEYISDEIDIEASDGQLADFIAGFRECICGWDGQLAVESIVIEEDLKNEFVSKRTKNAKRFENSFLSRCTKKGWVIEKGNIFANYILFPKRVRNKFARKKSKILCKAIEMNGLYKSLKNLFGDNLCEQSDYYPDEIRKVYGVPDFIILTPHHKLPDWVEVKYGTSKLSSIQRVIKNDLELMGFRYYIFRGGSISAFERLLRI